MSVWIVTRFAPALTQIARGATGAPRRDKDLVDEADPDEDDDGGRDAPAA